MSKHSPEFDFLQVNHAKTIKFIVRNFNLTNSHDIFPLYSAFNIRLQKQEKIITFVSGK